jgi:hypothetical protein
MKFPYRAYEVAATPASVAKDGCIYRPVVPFTLAGPTEALDFFGLLDTGADETYITRRMADRLGLLVRDAPEYVIDSAGGGVAVTYGVVAIEVTDGKERYSWQAAVGITDQEWSEAILGHSGFLEFFDTLFRGFAHEVELNRNEHPFASDSAAH